MTRRSGSRATVRYAFDDANRLVIRDRSTLAARLRPARVVDGSLTTDRWNRLIYRVSSGLAGEAGSETVNLDGAWRLTPNHELALTLHGSHDHARQTLYLKGAIVGAEADALIFAVRRREDDDLRTAERLTLFGRWRADAQNRLNFLVEKADGSEDRLTLQGGWEVGPHHELLYRYRRRDRDEHTLIFHGAWDITTSDRLVYRLEGLADSAFEFRVGLQSPSLLARDGRIAYQVGIGLSGGRVRQQRITLFGTWKLHRNLSVSFEIPYADDRMGTVRFEGMAALSPRDRIAVALSNSRHQGLGLTVTFTRELVPDASLFVRLRKDAEEGSVVGGVQVRF
ncbi:MAG: hypothetical protein HYY90_03670 [Candidatus Omnitrophica bacterium]|nr:hypothetical protein [Candidatus Omnitrophota bacterium]MBI3022064.1 hypothetical protein [Candidatus Omnitrophota bacterium]MBI3083440.1 hypothetical protein [Candidatus Omnitrophota bacterium]